ncbi:hypothetical protein BaRGS_00012505, partial [Batillaria attramentaria]
VNSHRPIFWGPRGRRLQRRAGVPAAGNFYNALPPFIVGCDPSLAIQTNGYISEEEEAAECQRLI